MAWSSVDIVKTFYLLHRHSHSSECISINSRSGGSDIRSGSDIGIEPMSVVIMCLHKWPRSVNKSVHGNWAEQNSTELHLLGLEFVRRSVDRSWNADFLTLPLTQK